MKINPERVRKKQGVRLLGEVRLLDNIRYVKSSIGSGPKSRAFVWQMAYFSSSIRYYLFLGVRVTLQFTSWLIWYSFAWEKTILNQYGSVSLFAIPLCEAQLSADDRSLLSWFGITCQKVINKNLYTHVHDIHECKDIWNLLPPW